MQHTYSLCALLLLHPLLQHTYSLEIQLSALLLLHPLLQRTYSLKIRLNPLLLHTYSATQIQLRENSCRLPEAGFALGALLSALPSLPETTPILMASRSEPPGQLSRSVRWVRRIEIGGLPASARQQLIESQAAALGLSAAAVHRLTDASAGCTGGAVIRLVREVGLRMQQPGVTSVEQAVERACWSCREQKSSSGGWPSESHPLGTMAQLGGCTAQKRTCERLLRAAGLTAAESSNRPALAAAVGVPRGVLLYGVSGSGKSLLAHAMAEAAGGSFVAIQVSELLGRCSW